MQHVIFTIAGMTCGGCVSSITRVLKDLAGVGHVEVTLVPSQAKVTFDESLTSIEALSQAIQDAGFTVTTIR